MQNSFHYREIFLLEELDDILGKVLKHKKDQLLTSEKEMRPFFSFMHQKCKLHERLIILISKLFIDTKTLFLCNQDIEANISATSTTKHKSTVFLFFWLTIKLCFCCISRCFRQKKKQE